MNTEQIARIAHETNRAYCESIGDNSQPPWQDAPDWQKLSAINGVKFHLEGHAEARWQEQTVQGADAHETDGEAFR